MSSNFIEREEEMKQEMSDVPMVVINHSLLEEMFKVGTTNPETLVVEARP
jgi:hypothetical protein